MPDRPDNLFCAVSNSSRPLSKNGVSLHLRSLIKQAHAELDPSFYDICRVKAHEVRGVATSMRFNFSMNVMELMYAAAWRCHSIFAMRYLKDVETDFGDCCAFGPFVAAGAVIS